MQTKMKQFFLALSLPLAVGALSAFLTRRDMDTFELSVKPLFYPPDWLFPVVWTILFALMGIASYRILRAHKEKSIAIYRTRIAIAYYVLGLAVNFLWPFVFFHYRAYYIAFAVLCALFYIAFRTYYAFSSIDRPAGLLLMPYLVWLVFAGYLNLTVAMTA